ncbi:hypothetical protein SAMN06265360_12214 [Haloechinothrix alba]|uniref:Dolichyl-phosphate-mannose-protein mannosyltransferase n=1 Tax=Haloechinothrix alba TaxID=664784 RepID=A0A238ZKF1_9PSEU|nr:hypothetical protein [Haloechinothrix alba]SNR83662.1 hypothetical protein SAMN06265360_12214 [Haloechinothrix alba]
MNSTTRDRSRAVLTSAYTHAVAVYLLVRVAGLALLTALAATNDTGVLNALTSWDGGWYLALAERGYDNITDADGFVDARGEFAEGYTAYAFFPLYPMLIAAVSAMPGIGVVPAALGLNVVLGAVAVCGVLRLTRLSGHDDRTGLVLVALWAGAPMAVTLSMAYTEALFSALAVWALVFALQREWIPAGLCCLGAGLTRSTATVLIGVIVLAALVSIWRRHRIGHAITGVLIAPLGLLAYWMYTAGKTSSFATWFEVQEGWGSHVDYGVSTLAWVTNTMTGDPPAMDLGGVLIVLGAVVLAVLTALNRMAWPLVLYGIGTVLLVIAVSGIEFSKPRFLLPAAFVLLMPVAIGLAKRHTATLVTGTAGIVALGSWYSAYSLIGWPYAV